MDGDYPSGSVGWAVKTGNLRQLKYLLSENKRVIDINSTGFSPLILALGIDDDVLRKRIFNFLLSKGAEISYTDRSTKRDVFAWACCLGREEQALKMLQSNPGEFGLREMDTTGYLPIHHAVRGGNPVLVYHLVREMLRFGVTVDMPNLKDGLTPLLMAKRLGFELVSQVLLSEGKACPTQFDTTTFRTKTRWSEVGCDERNRDHLNAMVTELRINGSTRPHTSYQRRREQSAHQQHSGRPQTTQSSRDDPPTPVRSTRSARSTKTTMTSTTARPPPKELYGDLLLSEVKQVADGTVKVADVRNLKAQNSSDDSSSGSSGAQTRVTRGTTNPSDKQGTWTKLNNLMSLSDKAAVLSTDRFARSVSVAANHKDMSEPATTTNSAPSQQLDDQSDQVPMQDQTALMITTMMTAASQQMSSAFRKPAVPKPKPDPPKPRLPVKRKKGSTLAYIMQTGQGRQRRGSRAFTNKNTASGTHSRVVAGKEGLPTRGYSFGRRSEIKRQTQAMKKSHNLPTLKT